MGEQKAASEVWAEVAATLTEVVSNEELETLLRSLKATRGERGFTEIDATAVQQWAIEIRLESLMLDMVLQGTLGVDVVMSGEREVILLPAGAEPEGA